MSVWKPCDTCRRRLLSLTTSDMSALSLVKQADANYLPWPRGWWTQESVYRCKTCDLTWNVSEGAPDGGTDRAVHLSPAPTAEQAAALKDPR